MRITLGISLGILVVLQITPPVEAQGRAHSELFDPSGSYHPERPPQFPSDRFIHFALRVKRNKPGLSAFGEIRGVQKWYRFKALLKENILKFVTDPDRAGVRYRFDGHFLRTGNFARRWSGRGMVVLRGHFRKYVRGKEIWQYSTGFVYYPPH